MEGSSSPSTVEANKNLNVKYQKLAAEYAKLRSQVTVLKKAVVEEQSKTENLTSQLQLQDQTVRKLEQELDSVKFRNRQLEKRIEVLQESDPGSRAQQVPQSLGSSSVDTSLLLHVEQNKQLQESLAMLNERYNSEVGRLKRMIDHELVPRELLENMKVEHADKCAALGRRLQEAGEKHNEMADRIQQLEVEKRERTVSGREDDVCDEVGLSAVRELAGKLSESQVAKEKLQSEVHILRMKLKRVNNNGNAGGGGRDGGSQVTSPVGETCNLIGRMSVIVGDGEDVLGGVVDEENGDTDEAYLRVRIDELVRACQLADSKAVHYYHEAFNLSRLVKTSQVTYKRLDNEFAKLKAKHKALGDELEDVKKVYEAQVDSLTEHIACMNDKLAGQAEEILRFKQAAGSRS